MDSNCLGTAGCTAVCNKRYCICACGRVASGSICTGGCGAVAQVPEIAGSPGRGIGEMYDLGHAANGVTGNEICCLANG